MKRQVLLNETDWEFFKGVIGRSVEQIKRNTSRFEDETKEKILRTHEAFQEAPQVDAPDGETSPPPEPKVAKAAKKSGFIPNLCKTHPDYAAVRPPRRDCDECWAQYKRFHPESYEKNRRNWERSRKEGKRSERSTRI